MPGLVGAIDDGPLERRIGKSHGHGTFLSAADNILSEMRGTPVSNRAVNKPSSSAPPWGPWGVWAAINGPNTWQSWQSSYAEAHNSTTLFAASPVVLSLAVYHLVGFAYFIYPIRCCGCGNLSRPHESEEHFGRRSVNDWNIEARKKIVNHFFDSFQILRSIFYL